MSTKKQRTFALLKRLNVLMLTLSVTATVCYSQDMVNSGTITNSGGGKIKIKGSMTTTQTSYSDTVEFYGGGQTIPAITYRS